MTKLPSALQNASTLWQGLTSQTPAVFLDYDGTLTPIVDRPDLAILSNEMKTTLHTLSKHCPVAILSGRGREDVEALIAIPNLYYAGSHGFDIRGPKLEKIPQAVLPMLPLIDQAYEKLRDQTQDIDGCLIEHKKFALALHYRLVNPSRVPELEAMVDTIVAAETKLKKTTGKKVFEIRPNLDWDKGKALLYLWNMLGQDKFFPFYLGDDDTDEDAFAVLRDRGIGILVGERQSTQARYGLKNVEEVKSFLNQLTLFLEHRT